MSHVVVKRNGADESFDLKKIYASIYTSMLAARETTKTAEHVASEVSRAVQAWAQELGEITSHDIRVAAAKKLVEYNTNAHFLYVHHKLMF